MISVILEMPAVVVGQPGATGLGKCLNRPTKRRSCY